MARSGQGEIDIAFGAQVDVYRTEWASVKASVEALERGNWDSVWFADHFIPPGGGGDDVQEAMNAFEGLAGGGMALAHCRTRRTSLNVIAWRVAVIPRRSAEPC